MSIFLSFSLASVTCSYFSIATNTVLAEATLLFP